MRREELKLHTARGVHVINTEITETQEEKALGLDVPHQPRRQRRHAVLL